MVVTWKRWLLIALIAAIVALVGAYGWVFGYRRSAMVERRRAAHPVAAAGLVPSRADLLLDDPEWRCEGHDTWRSSWQRRIARLKPPLRQVWATRLPGGRDPTMAVGDGRVVVTLGDPVGTVAYDLLTGRELWNSPRIDARAMTPIVTSAEVVVGDGLRGDLYFLDPSSGAGQSVVRVADPVPHGGPSAAWHEVSAHLVDGRVLMPAADIGVVGVALGCPTGRSGPVNPRLVGPVTREPAVRVPMVTGTEAMILSRPIAGVRATSGWLDGWLGWCERFYGELLGAYRWSDGAPLWERVLPATMYNVILTRDADTVYALVGHTWFAPRRQWVEVLAIEAATGRERWRIDVGDGILSRRAVANGDGRLFHVTYGVPWSCPPPVPAATLIARATDDGRQLWSCPIADRSDLVLADGVIYSCAKNRLEMRDAATGGQLDAISVFEPSRLAVAGGMLIVLGGHELSAWSDGPSPTAP